MPSVPRSRTAGPLLCVRESGRAGNEGPPPLILIHGLGTTQAIWDPVRAELGRRRRVVTLDVPGFGSSAPAGEGFELEQVAERVARGLAAHGVRGPFDVVGHSLGGAVALTLAAARARLVSRLVLVAPAGLQRTWAPMSGRRAATALTPAAEAWFAARRRLAGLTDLDWGRRILLALAVADGAELAPGQARAMVQASQGATRIGAAFATVAASDLRPLLSDLPVPVGLIWGERDRTILARTARRLIDERPDAPLETVLGAGHVPMVERPVEFVAALHRVLRRLDNDATTRPR